MRIPHFVKLQISKGRITTGAIGNSFSWWHPFIFMSRGSELFKSID